MISELERNSIYKITGFKLSELTQKEDSREYTFGPVWQGLEISLTLLFLGINLILLMVGFYCVIVWVIMAVIRILTMVRGVNCGKEDILVRYWYRPAKQIMFSDIERIKIVKGFDPRCEILIRDHLLPIPIVIRLGKKTGLRESSMLVSAIVERASLSKINLYISQFGVGTAQFKPER